MVSGSFHIPVLENEVIKYLVTNKSGIYVDCTLGGGGHSLAILKNISNQGKIIGVDLDLEALDFAQERLKEYSEQVVLIHSNFVNIEKVLNDEGVFEIDGVLMDLGVSSHQIDSAERGFSYSASGPLDMRMNKEQAFTAESIINNRDMEELVRIFKSYGEERYARPIAKAIVRGRNVERIMNTEQLINIIATAIPGQLKIKSFARIFQALRIEVNQELTNLENALTKVLPFLKKGGRIVVISYHSLEDKIVKNFFKIHENPCICPPDFPTCVCGKKPSLHILTRRIVRSPENEIQKNIRSRSAKLRVAEKI